MGPLLELARAHGLRVVEDNAQAFGAEYRGRRTGSLGDVGCLSFFPSKSLGAYGDAGMVVTTDGAVAGRVRMLRTHGWRRKYEPEMTGYNSRLDELQAAVLRVKLRHVERWNDARRAVAAVYARELGGLGIHVPREAPDVRHVYHVYVIRVPDRDAVQRALAARGIASAVYYPQPLHAVAPLCARPGATGVFDVADRCTRETLAIPLYPEMSATEVDRVVQAVVGAVANAMRETP
jgi:dTDP-4-amino-4,6-dideoxygalactose transaminase